MESLKETFDSVLCRKGMVKRMKILVFGAGVLGSLYAARLQAAGNDVTVVARGQRYEDIKKYGIILEYFDTGKRKQTRVKVTDRMPVDDYYDFCLVPVRKTQLDTVLPILAANSHIPAFMFMVNTAEGPQAMFEALGRERVLLSFANAGGERDGTLVRLMVARSKPVTLGEPDGSKSERLLRIAAAFKGAGFPVEISPDMDAWLRYHVALVGPLANALYAAGSCNYRLASNRDIIRKGLQAIREAVGIMEAQGIPPQPPSIKYLFKVPDLVMIPLMQRLLALPIMDIGGKRHAIAGREELTALNEELFAMARKIGMETPAMTALSKAGMETPASDSLE